MQLRIKSGLRRLWRATDAVQIGLSPRRGTVLDGLTAADLPLLEELQEGVDAAVFEAADDGLGTARRRELVRLLTEAGVLIGTGVGPPLRERLGPAADRLAPDAAIWSVVHSQVGDGWGLLAARSSRHVVVVGAGRLGSTLAGILAAAGVGQVTIGDPRRVTAADLTPGGAGRLDIGRPREEAALDAVRRFGGRAARVGSGPAQWREHRPDLVVLIQHGPPTRPPPGRCSAPICPISRW